MAALRVHEWCNEYQVPRSHPAPHALSADLDRLAPRLAEALADAVRTLLADDTDAVVLLPSLTIDCEIDTASPPEQIVRYWSRQLALALARALEDPAGGVLRFRSRAAYRARFIAELVHGRGWDSWLYRPFAGLRALPVSAAIRTLLTEDVNAGLDTLAALDEATWLALAATLPPREAVRVLVAWHERAHDSAMADESARRLAAAPPRLDGAAAPLLALRWLAFARGSQPPRAMPIGTACWLATLLALPPGMAAGHVARIAREADFTRLAEANALVPDADWLHLLAAAPPPEREAAAALATVARPPAGPAATTAGAAGTHVDARFGGLAWLLPALHDLLSPDVVAALPPMPGADAMDVATAATLAIAAGTRGELVWRDPFWRSFFRLPPALGLADLAAWLAPHDPATLGAALGEALHARALTGAALVRVPHHGGRRALAVEPASGCRLHAGRAPDDLPVAWPELRTRLALTRLLRRDAEWLGGSPVHAALPAAWQDVLETLAQAALRRTAFRIPGMARASLPHLFANVLNVRGAAQCAGGPDADWSLELGRPPLHVLLSINGMTRLRLAWPGARTLAVRCVE